MTSNRPFEADQAAGLRQLFASRRPRMVAGFIGAGRGCDLPAVIARIAGELANMGKPCVVVDEQPSSISSGSETPVRIATHPGGAARALDAGQFDEAEFVLVHAYPSVDSAIHQADLLVIVESAPLQSPETTRKILRATRRLADRTSLLITHGGDKAAVLSAKLDVERLSEQEGGQRIRWLGAIPTRTESNDLSANAAALRLTQWHHAAPEPA